MNKNFDFDCSKKWNFLVWDLVTKLHLIGNFWKWAQLNIFRELIKNVFNLEVRGPVSAPPTLSVIRVVLLQCSIDLLYCHFNCLIMNSDKTLSSFQSTILIIHYKNYRNMFVNNFKMSNDTFYHIFNENQLPFWVHMTRLLRTNNLEWLTEI